MAAIALAIEVDQWLRTHRLDQHQVALTHQFKQLGGTEFARPATSYGSRAHTGGLNSFKSVGATAPSTALPLSYLCTLWPVLYGSSALPPLMSNKVQGSLVTRKVRVSLTTHPPHLHRPHLQARLLLNEIGHMLARMLDTGANANLISLDFATQLKL